MSQRRLSGGLHGRRRADVGEGGSDPEAEEPVRSSRTAAAAAAAAAAAGDVDDDAPSAGPQPHAIDVMEVAEEQSDDEEDGDESEEDDSDDDVDGNDDAVGVDDLEHGQLVEVDGQVYRVLIESDEGEDEEDEEQEDEEDEDDEDGEVEVEEEEDEEERTDRTRLLRMLLGNGYGTRNRRVPEDIPRLPVPVAPLQSDFAARVNADTSARDVGQFNNIWASLDAGFDSSQTSVQTTKGHRRQQLQQLEKKLPTQPQQHDEQPSSSDQSAKRHCAPDRSSPRRRQQQQQQDADATTPSSRSLSSLFHSATSIMTRSSGRRAAVAAEPAGDGSTPAAAAAAAAAEDPGSSSSSSDGRTGFKLVNTAQMLFKREVSLGKQYGFSRNQQRHMVCHRALPLQPQQIRDTMQSRAYIGQYSGSGDFYITAYQDRRVRLYDTQHNWRLRKDVTTRMTRWTITDTTLSPDQRLLVYASISPVAFVVNVGSSYDVVESRANITELHEPLAFDGSNAPGAEERRQRRGRGRWGDSDDEDYEDYGGRDFGIWSIAWSPQGGQLIGGTNDNSVYVYDIESKRCLVRLSGHSDDVNAVAYLHGDTNSGDGSSGSNPHIVVSGSDDNMVRVWDLRDKSGSVRAPTGVLVGHTEGLTHICPKGDGYHLISNSKDQTIKLWDVRAALSPSAAAAAARDRPRIARWDYRWEDYPAAGYAVKHPGDVSLMTYRGHTVLQTLIRAYFSPMHTTGQRYIYAGSSDGVIVAWDVVSGKTVAQFEYHRAMVRDCSWHPYEPEMTSVSWDGSVVSWGPGLPQKQLGNQGRWGDVGRYY